MKLRFQADADLNEIIVTALLRREPGIDFQTATAGGVRGRDDREVLALSADAVRLLVTHDRKTMPQRFAEFIAARASPGVLIVPQKLPIADVVEDLLIIWTATEAEEWTNILYSLPL